MTEQIKNIIPMPKAALPISLSSERAAISCLMQNFACLDAMSWPEDLFFNPAHRVILRAIRDLHEEGVATDYFALQSRMERDGTIEEVGGAHELMDMRTVMPTGDPGVASWHRTALMEARKYRTALETIRKAEGDFARQEGDIAAVAESLTSAAAMVETERASTRQIIDALISDLERNEPVEAFGSGLPSLDRIAQVKRGELLTVAAPTSGGKSIMLLQMALAALRENKKVAIFSLEMPATQVVARILSAMCGFPMKVMRHAEDVTTEMSKKFSAASMELSRYSLEVESTLTDWEAIDGAVRELVAKDKADLVIVDYIQLIHLRAMGSNETREQHVSEITKRLKSLAIHLNVAVATASQLNDDNPPKLRESRAIGHHSDHVWFITTGDDGQFLTVMKNREGERFQTLPVLMNGATAQFVERKPQSPTK